MGLSKKLGGITQRVTGPEASDVPYKWSKQTYTVQEILDKFKLPCVVQCATESCTVLWSDFQFDLRQPLLFYSKRTVQKVHAISLKANPADSDTFDEIGPSLAIPADYEGWFGATPKGINKIKRHLRIEAVANSTARRFLVTTQCPAFTLSRTPNGSFEYVPHDVMSGEVLKRVCVMDGVPGDPDAPQILKDHGPCLECLDEKDEGVIIPLSRRVMCYELAEEYPDDGERVFRISAPITTGNSKFPRIFQLIHGEPPVLKYAFTGMMRCYSVFTEETILAATLDDPKSICLEMVTDSAARFRIGLNDAAIKKTYEYNNANQLCNSFGPKFLTGIKVSFSLRPECVGQNDVEMSSNDNESLSDMQDVNADSEFEIAWGSVQNSKLLTASKNTDDRKSTAETKIGHVTETVSLQQVQDISDLSIKSGILTIETNQQISVGVESHHHQEFTEQEMVDLMKRKGLLELKAETIPEFGSIREKRVRDNPLYYFMQRNPDKNPFNGLEDECHSDSSNTGDEALDDAADDAADDALDGTVDDDLYDTVKENPLMYLFRPIAKSEQAGQISSGADVENSTKESVEQRLSSASSVSGFDQVICKPAQEYKESHSESDSDGSESEGRDSNGSDSDGGDNDIFETSPGLIENSATALQIRPDILSSDDVTRLNKYNNNMDVIDDNSDYHIYENVDDMYEDSIRTDSDSESQAVDDLMSLALEETEKLSTSLQDVSVTSGIYERSHPASGGYDVAIQSYSAANGAVKPKTASGESSSEKDKSDEAVTRLNNLIEEVTALVNTSSSRILDVKRSPREINRSRVNSNTAKDEGRVSRGDRGSNKILNENPVSPSVVDLRTYVSQSMNQTYATPRSEKDVSVVPHLFGKAPSKESLSVLNLKSDMTGSKSDMTGSKSDMTDSKSNTTSLKSDMTGSIRDSVNLMLTKQKRHVNTSSFAPATLEPSRSKSDDSPGVLRRSRAESNLSSAASQGLHETKPTTQPLVVTSTSDPVLNSIVCDENSFDQRFLSRRITSFLYEHSPKIPSEKLIPVARSAAGSISRTDHEYFETVQGDRTDLKGNNERIISPASSVGSLNSSMTVVSCLNPDVEELDILSASEDVLESDSENNSELSHFSVRSERSLVLEKENVSFKRDSNPDLFKMADKFSFSRSGKLKSSKSKTLGSRANILSNDTENEDFV